ncbi:hypothetical protein BDV19DRAFT_71117 [Aspergillus venezuelensis]
MICIPKSQAISYNNGRRGQPTVIMPVIAGCKEVDRYSCSLIRDIIRSPIEITIYPH